MSKTPEKLDVRGLQCPLPVLKARKKMLSMPPGATLIVETTDPASVLDFPHYCNESGHELVGQTVADEVYVFTLKVKQAS